MAKPAHSTSCASPAVKADGKTVSMGEGLLAAVKAGGNKSPAISDEAKLRASALKFLAHTYLLSVKGNRRIWLHSSPKRSSTGRRSTSIAGRHPPRR